MKQWTEARLRSFVMSGLRRMTSRWGPKYSVLNKAFVEDQINPKTKRKRKMYRCAITEDLFPATEMQVDHIEPIVPLTWGMKSRWNELLPRFFCSKENLQAVSKAAHKIKTQKENEKRNSKKRR